MGETTRRNWLTPTPGNGRPRIPWTALWAGVVVAAGVTTTYVYATKAELAEHAKDEALISAELKLEAAVAKQALGHHDRSIEKIERYMEAQQTNIETFMRAVEIPSWKIARPKKDP